MKPPTEKEKRLYRQRFAALQAHIATLDNPNPESLSRSYGLPLKDVEGLVRSNRHDC